MTTKKTLTEIQEEASNLITDAYFKGRDTAIKRILSEIYLNKDSLEKINSYYKALKKEFLGLDK